MMRRFRLNRLNDTTGISGTGIVAEGVEFGDQVVVLRWLTDLRSTAIYRHAEDVIAIHGHNGDTHFEWIDE